MLDIMSLFSLFSIDFLFQFFIEKLYLSHILLTTMFLTQKAGLNKYIINECIYIYIYIYIYIHIFNI